MKKNLIMLCTAATVAAACMTSASILALADSGIRSTGTLAVEEEEALLCAADVSYLQSEMNSLTGELPDAEHTMPYDIIKDAARRNRIQSKGTIDYAGGTIILDASDLKFLADEVDMLENAYKISTAQALNQMGTYFTADASISYDPTEAAAPEIYIPKLSYDRVREGILQSQSVAHLAARQASNAAGELLFYDSEEAQNNRRLDAVTTDTNAYPLLIQAATADNLSAGTAAWVGGTLLIGNGADNQAYYHKGYETGGEEAKKHLYGGESFVSAYPDVCADAYFGSSDPLWTEVSGIKNEVYQIPLIDEQGRMLYGITFRCAYRARQHLYNEVSASGSYTLSTKEGEVIETGGRIDAVPYRIEDMAFTYQDVYIDLFSKCFSTQDPYLYLQLQGSAYARYVEFNTEAQAHANFHFTGIGAKYK